ncbi:MULTISPECIES: DUF6713 family protein [Haloferax]|uniref:Uncharacterized protein n=1 Tax=Haloferax marinum TaxID=2666143 RepID=A0A6A8G8V1_9EURY|nr:MULTISPECIES: DUF6713 family protein [Haloferax]KAB1197501.1 hypothetical protein Hfx1150_08215 [Haloferax sp. CBA1150]MRW96546.1 hypothetical protein [Haloferax marinum]
MVMESSMLFFSVVSFLFVHELDAIRQREWRFFFAPFSVRDETAFELFTALHAPLFVVVLLFLESAAFQLAFDSFAIVHGLLHLGLRNHPLIQFESWFSRFWIFGASVLGALHLAVVL